MKKSILLLTTIALISVLTGCAQKMSTSISMCVAPGEKDVEIKGGRGKAPFRFSYNEPMILYFRKDMLGIYYDGNPVYTENKFSVNVRDILRPVFVDSNSYPSRLSIDVSNNTLTADDTTIYNCDKNITNIYNAILPNK